MITFEQARQIALNKIGPDCALYNEGTIEKSYGWYFCYQSKAYIESGDDRAMLFGSGGFIVEREEGYVFEFGSADTLERNLEAYEAGLKYETYDLTVFSVHSTKQTVRLLYSLGMTYVTPEEAYGTVWRIPQRYTEDQIASKIASLPHTFYGLTDSSLRDFLKSAKRRYFRYRLCGHRAGSDVIYLVRENV